MKAIQTGWLFLSVLKPIGQKKGTSYDVPFALAIKITGC
jgi:hypothetical protein